jgi:hypothetical protein
MKTRLGGFFFATQAKASKQVLIKRPIIHERLKVESIFTVNASSNFLFVSVKGHTPRKRGTQSHRSTGRKP